MHHTEGDGRGSWRRFCAVRRKQTLEQQCLSLASGLIRIPSLTPISPALAPTAAESLTYLQSFLESGGARCHRLTFQGGHDKWDYPVDNLYAEWDGDEALGHLCFIGHTDVVPPGDLDLWRSDPFSGTVRDGFLWGRGSTDMKGSVAAFCVAGAACSHDAVRPRAKISLIITTDEEWAAINGTQKVLNWMRGSGRTPAAFLVGEPSSPREVGSHIKIGRRGSLCGTIQVKGVQGHAAYPSLFKNPNRALVLALSVLSSHRWPDAPEEMPPTAFELVALASGDFGATAIIPSQAQALWNIRFTARHNPDGLLAQLEELLERLPDWAGNHPDAASLENVAIIGHVDTASMPYYSSPAGFAHLVARSVTATTGNAPIFDTTGGTTDGRFIHSVFPQAEIVELGLPENNGDDGGMHQANERCSITDLHRLLDCYTSILSAYGQLA